MSFVNNVFCLLLITIYNKYTSAEVHCDGTKVEYELHNIPINGSYDFANIKPTLSKFCNDLAKNISFVNEISADAVELKEFEEGSLNNLKNVQRFSAKNNEITSLRKQEFHDLNMVKIDLSKNKLEKIVSNTFDKLPHLEYINLSGNKIATLEKDWFADCDNLFMISLYENNIKRIDNDMFANLNPTHYFTIKLGGNQIEDIESDAFNKAPRIAELTLHGNLIKKFDKDLLAKSEVVSLLDLGANQLKCLDELVVNKCQIVFLAGNKFDEECIASLQKIKDKNVTDLFW